MSIPTTIAEYKAALLVAAELTGSVREGAKLLAVEACLDEMRRPMTDAEGLDLELRAANVMISGAPFIPTAGEDDMIDTTSYAGGEEDGHMRATIIRTTISGCPAYLAAMSADAHVGARLWFTRLPEEACAVAPEYAEDVRAIIDVHYPGAVRTAPPKVALDVLDAGPPLPPLTLSTAERETLSGWARCSDCGALLRDIAADPKVADRCKRLRTL